MTSQVLRLVAVVPVGVAAALWTVHLAAPTTEESSAGALTSVVPSDPVVSSEPTAPMGVDLVPPSVVEPPASTTPVGTAPTASVGPVLTVASSPSADDIPLAALAAYQRSESLIGVADPGCHLSWQLLAAVARIESDHGRHGGAKVGQDGVSRPAIIGPALNGRRGKAHLRDTDDGRLDADATLDRAVGPFQFIPSTWAVVGVDGDSDGQREPQDVDDAALAAAVYLCSGADDLATRPGQREALLRYNRSGDYAAAVLDVLDDYLAAGEPEPQTLHLNAGQLVPVRVGPTAAPVDPDRATNGASRLPDAKGARDSAQPAPYVGDATPEPTPEPTPESPPTPEPSPESTPVPEPTP
ncbi:lytic murein transglycosylase, partial [Nocardioides sp.]|uniref:lytic murein transglycosylase n=1 Tax=Nocardioides sp. TaxID=35761 RepID=UPI002B26C327